MARRLANRRRFATANVEKNKQKFKNHQDKIKAYQSKIEDESYISYAINQIAQELIYFLSK